MGVADISSSEAYGNVGGDIRGLFGPVSVSPAEESERVGDREVGRRRGECLGTGSQPYELGLVYFFYSCFYT